MTWPSRAGTPPPAPSDVTEHVETFDIDGNGRSASDPAHDAAGNMTFDGTAKFGFDGWNRLVSVAHAYGDGGGQRIVAS